MRQVPALGTIAQELQKSARIPSTSPAQLVTSSEYGIETRPPYSWMNRLDELYRLDHAAAALDRTRSRRARLQTALNTGPKLNP